LGGAVNSSFAPRPIAITAHQTGKSLLSEAKRWHEYYWNGAIDYDPAWLLHLLEGGCRATEKGDTFTFDHPSTRASVMSLLSKTAHRQMADGELPVARRRSMTAEGQRLIDRLQELGFHVTWLSELRFYVIGRYGDRQLVAA
jgi:hypothetical protein